jgi:glycosyltransferase involved in cell wall biosynthesis
VSEGFGLSALEAMASGLPVVASAVGGLNELVEDGVTGFLVPPRDARELADRIDRLLRSSELRMRMGAAARARASAMFSREQMVETIEGVYRQLLDG